MQQTPPHWYLAFWLFSLLLICVAACTSAASESARPTELRIVTAAPGDSPDLAATVGFLETQVAQLSQASPPSPVATLPSPSLSPSPSPLVPTSPPLAPSPTAFPAGFPSPEVYSVVVVEQIFERGRMIWFDPLNQIWVLSGNELDPQSGSWQCYPDTYSDDQPERVATFEPPPGMGSLSALPEANPQQPIRGFGKLWREDPALRNQLGWALAPETLFSTRYEYQAGGEMQGGVYQPGPGSYRLQSLYLYHLVLSENSYKAPCESLGGTWRVE